MGRDAAPYRSDRHMAGGTGDRDLRMHGAHRFLRVLSPLLISLLLILGSGGPDALRAQSSYTPTEAECEVLELINDYRAERGLKPLVLSETLGAAARDHSEEIAESELFSHTMPDGSSWSDNIRAHGYTYNTWIGENLAAGYSSPVRTVEQWQQSAAHNANLLESDFVAIGIGLNADPDSLWRYYWTTTFGGYVDEPVTCED